MKVIAYLDARHAVSCAQNDPTPDHCDCGAQRTPLVSLAEAESEVKSARAQASPAKPDLAGLTEAEAFDMAVSAGRKEAFAFRIPGTSKSHTVECAILEPADALKFAISLLAAITKDE